MDEFSPADRPAFRNRATAEATPYAGTDADYVPTFDDELIPKDPAAPSRGIINRYKEIARLHAWGKTNNEICRHLGYTPSRMSVILKDPFVQSEITMWRDRMMDEDVMGVLASASKDGAQRLHRMILDPATKDTVAVDSIKFAIEKTHGKARQEVSVESGTLTAFTEMLREMQRRGEPIDVGPSALPEAQRAEGAVGTEEHAAEPNRFETWISTELDRA